MTILDRLGNVVFARLEAGERVPRTYLCGWDDGHNPMDSYQVYMQHYENYTKPQSYYFKDYTVEKVKYVILLDIETKNEFGVVSP